MKRLFERGEAAQVRADMREKIENILAALDAASASESMNLPGFRLHPLKGELRGYRAVAVRANGASFDGADAADVGLIDYHQD